MDASTLMKMHPFLDEMMAETLIKAHEGGYLERVLADVPVEEQKKREDPKPTVLKGAISVTDP